MSAAPEGLLRHPLLRFAAVGVLNTVLSLSLIFSLKAFAGVGDVPANMAGYALGLSCSFLGNRRWTFAYGGPLLPAILRFLGVFAGAYLLNLGIVLTLIRHGFNGYLAHAVGVPPYTISFYLGCRYFVFAARGARGGEDHEAAA